MARPDRKTRRAAADSSEPPTSLSSSVLGAWATNNRTTIYLVERIPPELWAAAIPGVRGKTIGTLAAHLHNQRSGWIRTLGHPHGVKVPPRVDRRRVKRAELARALEVSGRGIGNLLELGIERGGSIPPTPSYVWRNLPLDVGHVQAYFVAHEAHHRGQIVMLARQLGHLLPEDVVNGLWQWNRRSTEGA